ncbi:Coenzyme F420 hydrogenase/dehydrogenase, beta subunit C-terminal domain [Acidaminococcus massiliensis]|uniref:Coenzyme F420 hydrogenase/dehydrogenase, beta subunit C-terminal domain n=1 Tax=Acidaminococcus massiliensis TaxID=1852375 RepID=UPI0026DCD617|nr:Coenzyme F420 hydrogenase/dehydrogenase, beta subunit C-terminal domain [Acidaminococcus massiliensis]
MKGYLQTGIKSQCFGCEACAQICPVNAIQMQEDDEKFRYPSIDESICIHCGKCLKVCPVEQLPPFYQDSQYTFGGYYNSWDVRNQSTSGGAFTAILESWFEDDSVIFGAVAQGLYVYHTAVNKLDNASIFRKSKYLQSRIDDSYKKAEQFLKEGKKVLFSGTPCQIAGLRTFLKDKECSKLLTIEVICEGVPSPLFMESKNNYFKKKYHAAIKSIDYRDTDVKWNRSLFKGKWDFEVMSVILENGKTIKQDRWFNPFWKLWLSHLMSRPSCYQCPFTRPQRGADITLGDLWGVHLYCPELYGDNGGASLIVCNTQKGKDVFDKAKKKMYGHSLDFSTALKYQSPMRKCIAANPKRIEFMSDLKSLSYEQLCNKWYFGPSLKLLWQKYIWGNRQKILAWNMLHNQKKEGQ